jgi:hypothetical protein
MEGGEVMILMVGREMRKMGLRVIRRKKRPSKEQKRGMER